MDRGTINNWNKYIIIRNNRKIYMAHKNFDIDGKTIRKILYGKTKEELENKIINYK